MGREGEKRREERKSRRAGDGRAGSGDAMTNRAWQNDSTLYCTEYLLCSLLHYFLSSVLSPLCLLFIPTIRFHGQPVSSTRTTVSCGTQAAEDRYR